jgi:hypothetical protein
MSAGGDGITVSVDVVTETGTVLDAGAIVIDASAPALVPLSDIAAAPYGIRVRSSGPIAASTFAVVPSDTVDGEDTGEGGDGEVPPTDPDESSTTTVATEEEFTRGLAGTVGAPSTSSKWIVPLDTLLESETTLWVMNNTDGPASVSLLPLAETELPAFEVTIEPGTIVGVPVDVGIGTFGFTVTSDRSVSVAWDISGPRGVALVAGIAIL